MQRVLDAQHENQDAIAEWVLGSIGPKRRLLFARYYYGGYGFEEFETPQTVLQKWEAVVCSRTLWDRGNLPSALTLLRLWYVPGNPSMTIKEAPVLTRSDQWNGQSKRSKGILLTCQEAMRPHVLEGRLLAQLCLLLTMNDASSCPLWQQEGRWALQWVRHVATDPVHALQVHALNVMMAIHKRCKAEIMVYPALDMYALTTVPNLSEDDLSGYDTLSSLCTMCVNEAFTDAATVPTCSSLPVDHPTPTRVPWSRPHAVKVASLLLEECTNCWDQDAHHDNFHTCRCGRLNSGNCLMNILAPLLCVLMVKPTEFDLPARLWHRVCRLDKPAAPPGQMYYWDGGGNADFRRTLAFTLAMLGAVPEGKVEPMLQSPFLFPMLNHRVLYNECKRYHRSERLGEWSCVVQMLENHPTVTSSTLRVLQQRLERAIAQGRLHHDLVASANIMRHRVGDALVQALRWSKARRQWVVAQLH